jgi:2-polyprenyl-3-methyl-5-hydroxy-6-metoxy-1,4-benzoquinol methylase
VTDLTGLRVLDLGCSTGFISDELYRAGATVTGVDIDEPGLARAFTHIYEHVVDPDAVLHVHWIIPQASPRCLPGGGCPG